MISRDEHLHKVAAALEHVPEVVELVARHRQLVDAAQRFVKFARAVRPPGRLGQYADDLATALEPIDVGDDPTGWDVVEWRRRCAAAGVAQAQILRHAVDVANAAGIARPHSLNDIPADIAAEVAALLTNGDT